ncbi:DUF3450 domain-containing protein [Methylobacter marinus]|uniref:DUF3450 domain-containing protein n=1 Tax=Methylobacter marinus TaxID=34058 RepID=UPI001E584CEB|nr:DUF3450 domain-containing protein [Methylobacter marinus]
MLISCRPPSCLAAAMLALCALAAPGQAVSAAGAAGTVPQAEAPGAPDHPLLAQYRAVSRQTAALTIYNRHLQDLLASQAQEKTSLEQQLKDIEVTKQEIVPLILHMLDSLEQFVRMDLPFLPEERQQRLAQLKALVVRPDSTEAEKFRRLMEAFQVENEYGNTIEAYKGNIVLNGTTSSVNFLRLGRVALYYQRLDGSETGFWNKEEKRWQTLPADYRNAIRDGLRIARKETAPDLLTLPVPAPEAAR